ncbi:STAC3 isoform 3 [Pongo abelii]|uniref:STAC3 isoform 3 n=1 Tax=Pongo abelii TaxID=9601 RepID=A0A2J8UH97_PONAB|nr:STAC3 isoform 3 [Pongo abelii]
MANKERKKGQADKKNETLKGIRRLRRRHLMTSTSSLASSSLITLWLSIGSKPWRRTIWISRQERRSQSLMTPMKNGGGGKLGRRSDFSLQTSSFGSGLENVCTA